MDAIRTVTAFGGQKTEENRSVVEINIDLSCPIKCQHHVNCRYENGLNKVYKIGIRKGVIIGLCQAVTNTTVGVIFAIAAWYGPYLLRSECTG